MPVKDCEKDGKPGKKWGDEGKCYRYGEGTDRTEKEAEELARKQGVAARLRGMEERKNDKGED